MILENSGNGETDNIFIYVKYLGSKYQMSQKKKKRVLQHFYTNVLSLIVLNKCNSLLHEREVDNIDIYLSTDFLCRLEK